MRHQDTFDEVANLYADARPGYPDRLFTDLAVLSGLTPADRILEVGCGGGQATQDLARTGSPILALDPGSRLVCAARRKLAGRRNVAFTVAPFEAWPTEPGAFKLIAAAQSWHWVDPRIGLPKAADALEPDGWLAIFGHVPSPPAEPLFSAFEAIFARSAPDLWTPGAEHWYRPAGPIASQVAASALFGPVMHRSYGWSQTLNTADYLALCGTMSYYNLLPADRRQALFAAMAAAIGSHGGAIEIPYKTHLHMAQKLD